MALGALDAPWEPMCGGDASTGIPGWWGICLTLLRAVRRLTGLCLCSAGSEACRAGAGSASAHAL